MIIYSLIAAAALVLLWPKQLQRKQPALPKLELPRSVIDAVPVRTDSYIEAVAALQTVQRRLVSTGLLDEDQVAAVDTLTLALSRGATE